MIPPRASKWGVLQIGDLIQLLLQSEHRRREEGRIKGETAMARRGEEGESSGGGRERQGEEGLEFNMGEVNAKEGTGAAAFAGC